MNYYSSIKNLMADTKRFIQYKKLTPLFMFLGAIAVWPFILAALILTAAFYICDFFFRLASSSVNYLENWMNKTKEGTNKLSEAVVIWVCLPILFLLRIVLSIFTGYFFLIWFFIQACYYVATLGGTKWIPYALENPYPLSNDVATTNVTYAKASIVSLLSLFAIFVLAEILVGDIFGALFLIYCIACVVVTMAVYNKKNALPIDENGNTIDNENTAEA